MLVFISYPREFERVAATLDAELRSRNVVTFLDKESINLTDVWKLTIESNIARADIFVILYLPQAAIPGRFFRTEIERIRKECEKSSKKIITVIFPPTIPRDLPPFFRNHQNLLADAIGLDEDEKDDYWIDQIAQEVHRLKEIRKLKWRKIIARTAIAAGVMIIVLLYKELSETKAEIQRLQVALKKPFPKIESSINKSYEGESLCHSLIGTYELDQSYVFTAGLDTRLIATNGTWKATSCEYNKRSDVFILKGEDVTDFNIEMIINDRYERVAAATFFYTSMVSISRDGKLLGRTFEPIKWPQKIENFYKDGNGKRLNKAESIINQKIKDVMEMRSKKHEEIRTRTKYCTPALGESGGRITVAFICHGYTRAMVKISENLR